MIENGLLGKVVKIDCKSLIGFLYPNFPYVGHPYFLHNLEGYIYAGSAYLTREEKNIEIYRSTHTKKELESIGTPFISLCSVDGSNDIDLSNRENMLDLVYSKWALDYRSCLDIGTVQVLLGMDEHDFYDFIKIRWLYQDECSAEASKIYYTSEAVHKMLAKPVSEVFCGAMSSIGDSELKYLEVSITNLLIDSITGNYSNYKTDEWNSMKRDFGAIVKGIEKDLALVLAKYRNMSHDKRIKIPWLLTRISELLKRGEKQC